VIIEQRILTKVDRDRITTTELKSHYSILESSLLPDSLTGVTHKCLSQKLFIPEQILGLKTDGEFREVLSCFINLAAPREEHIRKINSLCERYGGYFNNIECSDKGWIGLVLFGAPVAYEKSSLRAVDFAYELRLLLRKRIRIGLSYGSSFTGFIGSGKRGDYTAIGMAVNLAYRYMQQAGWGEIWCDNHIRNKTDNIVHNENLGLLDFKGFPYAIETFRLLSKKGLADVSFYRTAFIGRRSELNKLAAGCESIWQGKFAGVTYIYGEAGQGKSRLIYELQQKLEEKVQCFILKTDSIHRQPLNPFAHWIRQLFTTKMTCSITERRKDFRHNWAEFKKRMKQSNVSTGELQEIERIESIIAGLIGLEWEGSIYANLEPKYRPAVKGFALKTLLETLCLVKPVILVIENLHWLDKESEEALQILSRRAADIPCKMIFTSRPLDEGNYPSLKLDPEVEVDTIYLDGLEQDETNDLMTSILHKDLVPEIVEYVYSLSRGNPFIIEQFSHYLDETDILVAHDDKYRLKGKALELPKGLQTVIVARLDRLEAELRRTIQTASVLGLEFAVDVLSKMIEILEHRPEELNDLIVKSQLHLGEQEHIWHALSEIRYIFSHALLRDTVYNMQLKKQLKKLHLLAGQIMEKLYAEDKTRLSEIARHYQIAEELGKALKYYEKAGDFEKERYYFIPSLKYYNEALEISQKIHDIKSPEIALILKKIGSVHFSNDDYNEALKYFEQALSIRKELYGEGHLHTADSLEDMGLVYHNKGEHDKALRYYEQALRVCKEVLGEKHHDTAVIINDIGILYRDKGDYDNALTCFRKSWSIKKGVLGERHPGTAACLTNIGVVFAYKQNFDEAIKCYEEALSINKESLDKMNPGTAIILNNLCNTYNNKGDYDQALLHIEQAIHIWKNIFGVRHSNTATGIMNMGNVFYYKGDCDRALSCYEQSLSCFKEVFGERHPLVADCLANIGGINCSIGDLNIGMQYLEKALSIRKEIYGEKYYTVAQCYANIGLIYSNQGDYSSSLNYLGKAHDIFKEVSGERHPDTATVLCTMAQVYLELGDYQKALSCLEKGLEIHKETLGERHPQIAITLGLIGLVYHHQSEYDNALVYHEQALSIEKEVLGDRHFRISNTLHCIGDDYIGKEEYDKALSYHEEALAIRMDTLDEKHSYIAASYHNIGDIYIGKGELDKALSYQEKALAMFKETLGMNHNFTAETLHSIGKVYAHKGDLKESLIYYEEALPIFQDVLGKQNEKTLGIIKDIIRCYEESGDTDRAAEYKARLKEQDS